MTLIYLKRKIDDAIESGLANGSDLVILNLGGHYQVEASGTFATTMGSFQILCEGIMEEQKREG